MPTLIGLVIAGIVAGFVVKDAAQLRREEVAAFGTSGVSPALWGTGVFLLMIVFLPWYLIWRSGRRKRLMKLCPHCAQSVSINASLCPYCRGQFVPSGPPSGQVAFPSAPPAPVMVAAAWLPDPTGEHGQRYWDGVNWTAHTYDPPPVAAE